MYAAAVLVRDPPAGRTPAQDVRPQAQRREGPADRLRAGAGKDPGSRRSPRALRRTHHDNVKPTGDDWSNVQGTVFEVTDAELARRRPVRSAVRLPASRRCHSRPATRRGFTCTSLPPHTLRTRVPSTWRAGRPSCRSSRRRWPGRRAARWPSPCRTPAGSARCRARCCDRADPQGARGDPRGDVEAVQRQLLLSSRSRARTTRAKRRGAAVLAPYFEEFGIDPTCASQPARPRCRSIDAAADLLEEFKPPVVSFHFGLPSDRPAGARVKSWGAKILSSATTVDEARWLEAHGVDAVIAQGLEAGGHRGMFLTDDLSTQVGTLALVPQIVQRREGAGDCRRRHRRRERRGGGAGARRRGRAGRHRVSVRVRKRPRVAVASRGAEERRAPPTALTNLFTGRPARGIVNRIDARDRSDESRRRRRFRWPPAAIFALRAKAEPGRERLLVAVGGAECQRFTPTAPHPSPALRRRRQFLSVGGNIRPVLTT